MPIKIFRSFIFILTTLYLILNTSTAVLAAATFSLNPASKTVAPGNTFDVTVQLDTGGQSVTGGTAILTYDPSKLSVLDASASQVGTQIMPGTVFNSPVSNTVDSVLGKITLDYGANQTSFSGTGVFGTISFKALAVGSVPVSFVLTGGTSNSAIYSAGANVLSAATNGSYIVSSSTSVATSSALPTTGNVQDTLLMIMGSIIFLSFGAVLFRFSR